MPAADRIGDYKDLSKDQKAMLDDLEKRTFEWFRDSENPKIGVTPDHLVLPTGADIVSRRDPQMAKALSLVGVSVSPEVAGAIYRTTPLQTSER